MSLKHFKDTLNAIELEIDIKVSFLERLFLKGWVQLNFLNLSISPLMNDHIPEIKDYYSTNKLKINI
jgi:hypothetical protein